MSLAALRLDSFSTGHHRPAPPVTVLDLDEAYHRGHEQGLAEGRERSLDALSQALAACQQDMHTDQQREVALRRGILASLMPVLHVIVDLLGPRSQLERLRLALAQEMARLAEHAPEQGIILHCPADLRPDLADCLNGAQFAQVQIQDPAPDQPLVQLVAGHATIAFAPDQIMTGLKTLIDDIMTEE